MTGNPNIDASDPNGVIEGAIAAHARALQVFHVPSGQMAEMLRSAKSRLTGQGIRIADLSASSSALLDAVQSSFAAVLGSFTEQQRDAQRERDHDFKTVGTGIVFDAFGRPIHGGALAMAARGQTGAGIGSSSAKYDGAPGSTASVNDPALASSLGISGATIRGMAALGFDKPWQVRALVKDADSLGVDRDRGALGLGELKRANPGGYRANKTYLSEYGHALDKIGSLDARIARETEPATKAALQRERDEAQKKLDEKKRAKHAKIKNPAEGKALDDMEKLIKENQDRKRQLGPDAARNVSSVESRASLSTADHQRMGQAEQQDRRTYAARANTPVTAGRKNLFAGDEEAAAAPPAAGQPATQVTQNAPPAPAAREPDKKPGESKLHTAGKEPEKPADHARLGKPAGPPVA